jgi:hypothetical protein
VPAGCPGKCGCSKVTVHWTGPAPLTQKLSGPDCLAGISGAAIVPIDGCIGSEGATLSPVPPQSSGPLQPLLCRWQE